MADNSTPRSKPFLFGDASLEATDIDAIEKFEAENFDMSYVPGYSEQRRINEHRVRKGQKAVPIDKLYWARTARADGSNVDYREAVTVSRLGYRACTLEDLRERGWGMPPGAHEAADGTIRMQDTTLAIVDSDRARKNKDRQERINAEFEGRDIAPSSQDGITSEASRLETSGRGASLEDAKKAVLARK